MKLPPSPPLTVSRRCSGSDAELHLCARTSAPPPPGNGRLRAGTECRSTRRSSPPAARRTCPSSDPDPAAVSAPMRVPVQSRELRIRRADLFLYDRVFFWVRIAAEPPPSCGDEAAGSSGCASSSRIPMHRLGSEKHHV